MINEIVALRGYLRHHHDYIYFHIIISSTHFPSFSPLYNIIFFVLMIANNICIYSFPSSPFFLLPFPFFFFLLFLLTYRNEQIFRTVTGAFDKILNPSLLVGVNEIPQGIVIDLEFVRNMDLTGTFTL